MTDLYSKNIQYFKRLYSLNYSINYDALNNEVEVRSTNNRNTFLIGSADKQIHIHSIYNIDDEFRRTFLSSKQDKRVLILYGVGNGSIFKYILENHTHYTSIILIEPSAKIFEKAFSCFDAETDFPKFQHIKFIIGKSTHDALNSISSFFMQVSKADFDIVKIISENILFDNYFKEITHLLTEWIRGLKMNISNYLRISQVNFELALLNLSLKHQEISKLKEYFKGQPVVIISAGPSLEKHYDKLEELKTKAVLISVGTATKIMSDLGIHPHFRAHSDHRFFEKIYTDDVYENSEDIPLLFSPKLNHEFLSKYNGNRYMILTNSTPYFQYLFNNIMNMDYLKVQGGCSTTNHIFNALAMLECDSIILIGQDMCSYDGFLYANKKNNDTVKNMSEIRTIDIYGTPVTAKKIYYQIKSDLEIVVNDLNITNALNATEGGLGVMGVPNVTLESLLQTTLKNQIELNTDINDLTNDNFTKYSSALIIGLKKTLIEFEEIFNTIKTIRKQINTLSSKIYKSKDVYKIASKLVELKVNSPLNNIPLFAYSFKRDYDYIKMMMSSNCDIGSNNVIEAFKAQSEHELSSMDVLVIHLRKFENKIKKQVEELESSSEV